jgi:hypothetical protein
LLKTQYSNWFYNQKLCRTTSGCKKHRLKFNFLTPTAQVCKKIKSPAAATARQAEKSA